MNINQVVSKEYQAFSVEFTSDAWIYVTPIAKQFGKEAREFLRLKSTKEYILALHESKTELNSVRENSHIATFNEIKGLYIQIIQGGDLSNQIQGTWFHPDLGVEFARWLNPRFGIWCNSIIKEVITIDSVQSSLIQDKKIYACIASMQPDYLDELYNILRPNTILDRNVFVSFLNNQGCSRQGIIQITIYMYAIIFKRVPSELRILFNKPPGFNVRSVLSRRGLSIINTAERTSIDNIIAAKLIKSLDISINNKRHLDLCVLSTMNTLDFYALNAGYQDIIIPQDDLFTLIPPNNISSKVNKRISWIYHTLLIPFS